MQVRQTIYSWRVQKKTISVSIWFLKCWTGGPLARAPCAQSFLREVLCWHAALPHWLRTLRQNFARVVSLIAFQHVSKHARVSLTQSWYQWEKRARNENRKNGKSALNFFLIFWSHFHDFGDINHANIPWTGVQCYVTSLVELAWTFYMFFKVASNFFNDFLNLLRKLQCVIISLLSSTFIKLLQRIIKVLAAISSREVLRVLSCISSKFKCIWDVHNFAAISMQFNFIHNVNSKLASSSASYLRSGG